ncbi:S16 family serine protease [Spirosoma koreense]
MGPPEKKGSHLIEGTPLSPGLCYTCTSEGDHFSLVRIIVVVIQGSGNLNISGTTSALIKKNIRNTYQYIKANEKNILNEQHSLSNFDMNIQISNLLGANIGSGVSGAVYIAIISAIYRRNLKLGLAVLGNLSIGGAIERVINFSDKISILSENGAKTEIVPMYNLTELVTVLHSVLGITDMPFYSNSQMLMQMAVLME